MLVSRYNETANPVVLNRLVASALLEDLRAHKPLRSDSLGITSILALLEMSRSNSFYEREPTGILQQDDFAEMNELGEADGFRCLEVVLKETIEEMSHGSATGDFVQRMTAVFRSLGQAGPGTAQTAEAETFLSELTKRLKRAEAPPDVHS
jgi:hypothetical protein